MNSTTVVAKLLKIQGIFRLLAVLQSIAHMFPKPAKVEDGAKFDFIIVGGGTAGCVIASKLAKYNVSVLLVEAGGYPPFESLYPAYFSYLKRSANDWNMTSTKEKIFKDHKGGVADISQGKMLGGTSNLNNMVYAHGNCFDYDSWAAITNDSSWSCESVIPIFRRNEGMVDPQILESPKDRALYGLNGQWKLKKFHHRTMNLYFKAFKEMGHNILVDINSRNPLGFSTVLFNVGKKHRSNSATFLRSLKNKCNFNLLTDALVTKILFGNDTTAALGVTIKTKDKKIITIQANKEVIITAGVLKTPQLLMVSGIGPKHHLEKNKVKVIKDLPVGTNLQDHPITIIPFKMGKAMFSEQQTEAPNPHLIPIPVFDGYIALNKSQNYPDHEALSLIIEEPETFLVVCLVLYSFTYQICDTILRKAEGKQIYLVYNHLSYPESRGRVLLNTTNMENQPMINTGYYDNEKDIEKHMTTTMSFNAVLNTTYFKSVGAELIDPELKSCVGLNKDSKDYWRCYTLAMLLPGQYFVGTCAMGTVVESNLLVKGIKNLRVADASVMPKIIGTLPLATVLVIAEKAVDFIVTEYCLK